MSTCAKCNHGFSNSDVIAVCVTCSDLYHAKSKNCADVTASEIKVMELKSSKPKLVYRCQTCVAAGGEDISLKEAVVDLQRSVKDFTSLSIKVNEIYDVNLPEIRGDVDALKAGQEHLRAQFELFSRKICEDVTELQGEHKSLLDSRKLSASTEVSSEVQTVISEIEDRGRRENNLLVFNVPENCGGDGLSLDVKAVEDILSGIKNIETSFNSRNVKRVGEFCNTKIRPILVKMISRSDVTTCLINWRIVPKHIRLSADLTVCQRETYKRLKIKANDYNRVNRDGESVKIVKFVKGNPKILTVKKKINKGLQVETDDSGANCSKN